jgi:hypothetical protein
MLIYKFIHMERLKYIAFESFTCILILSYIQMSQIPLLLKHGSEQIKKMYDKHNKQKNNLNALTKRNNSSKFAVSAYIKETHDYKLKPCFKINIFVQSALKLLLINNQLCIKYMTEMLVIFILKSCRENEFDFIEESSFPVRSIRNMNTFENIKLSTVINFLNYYDDYKPFKIKYKTNSKHLKQIENTYLVDYIQNEVINNLKWRPHYDIKTKNLYIIAARLDYENHLFCLCSTMISSNTFINYGSNIIYKNYNNGLVTYIFDRDFDSMKDNPDYIVTYNITHNKCDFVSVESCDSEIKFTNNKIFFRKDSFDLDLVNILEEEFNIIFPKAALCKIIQNKEYCKLTNIYNNEHILYNYESNYFEFSSNAFSEAWINLFNELCGIKFPLNVIKYMMDGIDNLLISNNEPKKVDVKTIFLNEIKREITSRINSGRNKKLFTVCDTNIIFVNNYKKLYKIKNELKIGKYYDDSDFDTDFDTDSDTEFLDISCDSKFLDDLHNNNLIEPFRGKNSESKEPTKIMIHPDKIIDCCKTAINDAISDLLPFSETLDGLQLTVNIKNLIVMHRLGLIEISLSFFKNNGRITLTNTLTGVIVLHIQFADNKQYQVLTAASEYTTENRELIVWKGVHIDDSETLGISRLLIPHHASISPNTEGLKFRTNECVVDSIYTLKKIYKCINCPANCALYKYEQYLYCEGCAKALINKANKVYEKIDISEINIFDQEIDTGYAPYYGPYTYKAKERIHVQEYMANKSNCNEPGIYFFFTLSSVLKYFNVQPTEEQIIIQDDEKKDDDYFRPSYKDREYYKSSFKNEDECYSFKYNSLVDKEINRPNHANSLADKEIDEYEPVVPRTHAGTCNSNHSINASCSCSPFYSSTKSKCDIS